MVKAYGLAVGPQPEQESAGESTRTGIESFWSMFKRTHKGGRDEPNPLSEGARE